MKTNTIEIGNDHAGFELKQILADYLKDKGITVNDHGCYSTDSVDYPDFAHTVADALKEDKEGQKLGILICGSGNGINMTANKHRHIRAALCWNAEIAGLARQHNNANVLTLPGRYISVEEAKKAVDIFITTAFEGGRHEKRVNKIAC